jgi:hypothetical protein
MKERKTPWKGTIVPAAISMQAVYVILGLMSHAALCAKLMSGLPPAPQVCPSPVRHLWSM